MAREGLRWVDPAPLEVARPRLPWWTMLPGWVKLLISPIVLVCLVIWLCVKLAHVPLEKSSRLVRTTD